MTNPFNKWEHGTGNILVDAERNGVPVNATDEPDISMIDANRWAEIQFALYEARKRTKEEVYQTFGIDSKQLEELEKEISASIPEEGIETGYGRVQKVYDKSIQFKPVRAGVEPFKKKLFLTIKKENHG